VRISKIRGKQLHHILYMAALNAKKTNAACRALYNRPVEMENPRVFTLPPRRFKLEK
jgi:hypothetical protein